MKKIVSIIGILLMLTLAACANQESPSTGAGNPGYAQSEGVTMLEEGVWPENKYTEGLPVPPGTVAWAALDAEHENCSVSITGISEAQYSEYMALLQQKGFSVIEEASEEVEGQDYVSLNTAMSNDEKALSISYIPDNLIVSISLAPEPQPEEPTPGQDDTAETEPEESAQPQPEPEDTPPESEPEEPDDAPLESEPVETVPFNEVPYLLPLSADVPIFSEPSYGSSQVQTVGVDGVYTIVEEARDEEGTLWGRLKSGVGWVDLT